MQSTQKFVQNKGQKNKKAQFRPIGTGLLYVLGLQ